MALNCPKVVFWERIVTHSLLQGVEMDLMFIKSEEITRTWWRKIEISARQCKQ